MDSSGSTLVKCPPKNIALSALQKQVWSKKDRETEIKKNILRTILFYQNWFDQGVYSIC